MDQILPPELSDAELEAMEEIAEHPATHHVAPRVQARLKDVGYAKGVLGEVVLTEEGLQRIAMNK